MEELPTTRVARAWRWLAVILAVSYVLRLVLIWSGGYRFWADESRFGYPLEAAACLLRHEWVAALRNVIGSADHLGFKVFGVIPGYIQIKYHFGYEFSLMFLGVFATFNIAWVWLIARRLGAGDAEALGSALAMGCANSMYYWSRHLMPYDLALFWSLACLYVALKPSARWCDSLWAGILGCIAFVTYNGYWTIVAVALVLHVLLAWPHFWRGIWRALWALGGLVGPYFLLLYVALWTLKVYLLESYLTFSGSINQGDFKDGYGVIVGYFWAAESLMCAVWLAAISWILLRAFKGRVERRAWFFLGAIVAIAGSLVVGANVLGKFVVYGRLARQMVPFLALLTGHVFFDRWEFWNARVPRAVAGGTLIALGAWNFSGPLRLVFPPQFEARGAAIIAGLDAEASKAGRPAIPRDRFRFIYTTFIWPAPAPQDLPPRYRVLLEAAHPLDYQPYMYEGFGVAQRATFRHSDFRMKLIEVKD